VIALAKLGYNILCEKPMTTTFLECKRMRDAVKEGNVIFAVGHVLRYSPYTTAVKKELDQKGVGEIINITHLEPIGHEHYTHSYGMLF
jgi:predicted dehydrogenase